MWLTTARLTSAPQPCIVIGMIWCSNTSATAASSAEATTVISKVTRAALALHPSGADRQKIKAEADAGRNAVEVADHVIRRGADALRYESRTAEQAEREPCQNGSADTLAEQQPAEHDNPERRQGGEEGRVRDGGAHDGEVPEEQVAAKARPEYRIGREKAPRRAAADVARSATRIHAQRIGRAERVRQSSRCEGSDFGEPDEGRRHTHRGGAKHKGHHGRGLSEWSGCGPKRVRCWWSRRFGPGGGEEPRDGVQVLWHFAGEVTTLAPCLLTPCP